MTWKLEADNGTEHEEDTFEEAKRRKKEMESDFGLNVTVTEKEADDASKVELDNAEVVDMSGGDGGNSTDTDDDDDHDEDESEATEDNVEDEHAERIKPAPAVDDVHTSQEALDAIDGVKDSGIDTDPLGVLPDFMVDSIKGAQAVNKRGYAMIAERYEIEVSTEMVQSPWDNEDGRVVCKATATTDDGKTYNAYGTACKSDGDDSANLIELADTRSQKRAIQWASGYGIVGYQELTGQLEDGGDGA